MQDFDWVNCRWVLMVFNGKMMVFNNWYSMTNTRVGVMAAILLFFIRRQFFFYHTINLLAQKRYLYFGIRGKITSTSISFIKVVNSLILTFILPYFSPDKHPWKLLNVNKTETLFWPSTSRNISLWSYDVFNMWRGVVVVHGVCVYGGGVCLGMCVCVTIESTFLMKQSATQHR